jgi:septal ring factor EnvC (AmiA/AmiB activator)
VKKVLAERARMHSLELGSKTWFVMYRIPELKVIIAGFIATTTSIDKKIQLLLVDAAERAAASQVKAQKKAEEQAVASAKAQKKAEAQAKKLEEKMDKILEQQKKERAAKGEQEKNMKKLIELLERQGRKVVQDIALGKGDGKKTADGLVDELVSGGMKRKDAKAGVEATMSAVRSESQSQKQTIKRVATDEAKKGVATAKPSAAKAQNTAKPGEKPKPEVKNHNIWILCADSANGRKHAPL